jgi:hypothetical protein
MYFGNETANYASVLGVYSSVMTSNKEGVILRCDNPDGVSGGDVAFLGGAQSASLTIRTAVSQDGEDTGEDPTPPPRLSFVISHTPTDSTTRLSACSASRSLLPLSPLTGRSTCCKCDRVWFMQLICTDS